MTKSRQQPDAGHHSGHEKPISLAPLSLKEALRIAMKAPPLKGKKAPKAKRKTPKK